MKHKFSRQNMLTVLVLLAALLLPRSVWSQDASVWIVKGSVADGQSRKPLGSVSVTDGRVGTVTNADGEFVLKLRERPHRLTISCLGYQAQQIDAGACEAKPLRIMLQPAAIRLSEIIVEGGDGKELVKRAIARIDKNYPASPALLHGFYRETVKKRNSFISIAEAVVDVYKGSYGKSAFRDRVAISKGRRLLGMKAADTLAVKLEGGPVIPIEMDVVKNPELLFSPEELDHYRFSMGVPERQGERQLYAVRIEPLHAVDYPLYYGTLYIDKQTLAFVRIDLRLDMADRQKVTRSMLRRKPATLRFAPQELSIRADYATDSAGVTRLHYVKSLIRFRCDWERRVFKSNFSVVAEMVVTDWHEGPGVSPIRGRDTFNSRDRFYDKVEFFDDPDFWGKDNIIEPTESLEKAVAKLRRLLAR